MSVIPYQCSGRSVLPTYTAPAASPRLLFLFITLLATITCFGQSTTRLLNQALSGTTAEQSRLVNDLQSLNRQDYQSGDALLIGQLVSIDTLGEAPEYIKLLGFLGREDLLTSVSEVLRERDDVRRAINLARVRAGNTAKRDNLLKNVRAIDVNDEFVYTVIPLLTYTRDRKVYEYLWELVLSENRSCTPADAETPGRIDCAYRIVEYMAGTIENFPVKVDEDYNLLTTDYAGALAEIRRWYAANQSTYRLLIDTY